MTETTELKEKIKQFIENKNVCVVATCSKNKPRASTVNYAANNFTLCVVTSAKSTKVKNIRTKICLQAQGIAKILTGKEAMQAKEFYSRKRDLSRHDPELIDTVLKIELKEIMLSDYTESILKIYKFNL